MKNYWLAKKEDEATRMGVLCLRNVGRDWYELATSSEAIKSVFRLPESCSVRGIAPKGDSVYLHVTSPDFPQIDAGEVPPYYNLCLIEGQERGVFTQ